VSRWGSELSIAAHIDCPSWVPGNIVFGMKRNETGFWNACKLLILWWPGRRRQPLFRAALFRPGGAWRRPRRVRRSFQVVSTLRANPRSRATGRRCESQVSRYRPPVCIYAMTPRENVGRQLMVNYGVIPVEAPDVASTDEMLAQMDRVLTERGYLKAGDSVVQASPWAVPAPPTS